jgi:hypothetical protein
MAATGNEYRNEAMNVNWRQSVKRLVTKLHDVGK